MYQSLLSVLIAFTLVFNPFLTSLSYPDGSAASKPKVFRLSLYLPVSYRLNMPNSETPAVKTSRAVFTEAQSSGSGGGVAYVVPDINSSKPFTGAIPGHVYTLYYGGDHEGSIDPDVYVGSGTYTTSTKVLECGTSDPLLGGENASYGSYTDCYPVYNGELVTYTAQAGDKFYFHSFMSYDWLYEARFALIDLTASDDTVLYYGPVYPERIFRVQPFHLYRIQVKNFDTANHLDMNITNDQDGFVRYLSTGFESRDVAETFYYNRMASQIGFTHVVPPTGPDYMSHNGVITITDLGAMYFTASTPVGDVRNPIPEDPCLANNPQKPGFVGDPVNTRSGNFTYQAVDFSIATQGLPLEFERSYNSLFAGENSAHLGLGWTHNYAMRLVSTDYGLDLVAPHGSRLPFERKSDGTLASGPGVRAKLVNSGNFYTLTQGNGIVYTFDGANSYRLTKIIDRNNNTTTLVYSTSVNLLERVYAPDGVRYLSFRYDNGFLKNLIFEPEHRIITYTYGVGSENDYLMNVIDPEGRFLHYNYNPLQGLDRIDNVSGTLLYNLYDEHRQVISQKDAFGNVTSFGYDQDHTVVTDALGNVTYYTYTKEGLPAEIADSWGHRVVYQYDENYNPIFIYDSSGDKTRLTWGPDSCGVTKIEDAMGNTTWMTYTDAAPYQLKALTDPMGNTTEFQYNTRGNLTVVTNALKNSLHFTYSLTTGQLLEIENPLAGSTRLHYDNYGNVKVITDALLNTTVMTYNVLGEITQIRDARGQTMAVEYDRSGLVKAITDTLGRRVMTYTYDLAGRLIEVAPLGRATTQFIYDGPTDRVLQVSQIGGTTPESTSYAYDELGRVTAITDAVGHYIHYAYDRAVPLVTVTNELNEWTSYLYDNESKLVRVKNSANQIVNLTYNAANRVTLITDETQHSWMGFTYDRAGNVLQKADSAGRYLVYSYDELNRVKTVGNLLGTLAQYSYDRAGNLSETLRFNATANGTALPSQSVHYTYDALNRLTQVFDPGAGGVAHQYAYDPVGNLTTITNTGGNTTTYTYDNLNRLVRIQNPLDRVTLYKYDDLALTQVVTQAPGTSDQTVVTVTYDKLGRPVSIGDAESLTVTYAYTSGGLRTWMTDTNWTTAYGYDRLGRPTGVTVTSRTSATQQNSVLYDYSLFTQSVKLATTVTVKTPEYITGYQVKYLYNNAGKLEQIVDWSDMTTTYHYSPTGELTGTDHPEKLKTVYSYDSVGRPVEVLYLDYESKWRTIYRYEYDKVGNQTAIKEISEPFPQVYLPIVARNVTGSGALAGQGSSTTSSPVSSEDTALLSPIEVPELPESVLVSPIETPEVVDTVAETPAMTVTSDEVEAVTPFVGTMSVASTTAQSPTTRTRLIRYTYDLQNRLISAAYTDTAALPLSRITYTYDITSNRTAMVQITNGVTLTTLYSYNAAGQLTDRDVVSGVAGSLLTSTDYLFDKRGNLIFDGVFTYTYDSFDRMVQAESITQTAIYTYNGDGLRLAQNINGVETRFTWDQASGLPQLLATSDGTRYLQGLGLEGVQKGEDWYYPMTDLLGSVRQWRDADGGITGTVDYDPFGVPMPQDPTARVSQIGFAGEWEDQLTGLQYLRARWYQPETGRFTQVDPFSGIMSMPVTQNPYTYGWNNPVKYTDPSGMNPAGVAVIAGLFGLGFVGGFVGDIIHQVMSGQCEIDWWHALGVGLAVGVGLVAATLAVLGLAVIAGEVISWLGLGVANLGALTKLAFVVRLGMGGWFVGQGLMDLGLFGMALLFSNKFYVDVVGFRGLGESADGMNRAGHFGISLNHNSGRVDGFHPLPGEAAKAKAAGNDFFVQLANEGAPGRMQNDTSIFNAANNLAATNTDASRRIDSVGNIITTKVFTIRIDDISIRQFIQLFKDSRFSGNSMYLLSKNGVPMPSGYNNCITYIRNVLGPNANIDELASLPETGMAWEGMKWFSNYNVVPWPRP